MQEYEKDEETRGRKNNTNKITQHNVDDARTIVEIRNKIMRIKSNFRKVGAVYIVRRG